MTHYSDHMDEWNWFAYSIIACMLIFAISMALVSLIVLYRLITGG